MTEVICKISIVHLVSYWQMYTLSSYILLHVYNFSEFVVFVYHVFMYFPFSLFSHSPFLCQSLSLSFSFSPHFNYCYFIVIVWANKNTVNILWSQKQSIIFCLVKILFFALCSAICCEINWAVWFLCSIINGGTGTWAYIRVCGFYYQRLNGTLLYLCTVYEIWLWLRQFSILINVKWTMLSFIFYLYNALIWSSFSMIHIFTLFLIHMYSWIICRQHCLHILSHIFLFIWRLLYNCMQL